jgi:hypothetical protein
MVATLGCERNQTFVNEMNETAPRHKSLRPKGYFVTSWVCNEMTFSCNETTPNGVCPDSRHPPPCRLVRQERQFDQLQPARPILHPSSFLEFLRPD